MKLKTLTALIVTTYIVFNPVAQASAPQPVFTPEQEARIGEITSEYLVAHPEILVTVSQKLQEQQQLRKQKLYPWYHRDASHWRHPGYHHRFPGSGDG